MVGRDLSKIRYLVEFVPIDKEGLDKARSWIEEGVYLDHISRTCQTAHARAELFDLEDVARAKRLVLISPQGLDTGKIIKREWEEKQRAMEEKKATAWEHLLRDEI